MEEVQKAAHEIKEMLQQVMACNTMNPIHSAKLTRIGELHSHKAKSFNSKVKAHAKAVKNDLNDCKTSGLKASPELSEVKGPTPSHAYAGIETPRTEGTPAK